MNLKDFYPNVYKNYINEADLSGKSRSKGTSNWEAYIVKDFDKNRIHLIENPSILFDESFKEIGSVKKGDEIYILSTKLKTDGGSKFANIKLKNGDTEGYVNISKIRKPTPQSAGSVISGGANSKEFVPDKLGIMNVKFTSAAQLIVAIKSGILKLYSDDKYIPIRKYLSDAMTAAAGTKVNLMEGFSKSYTLNGEYGVSEADIRILSKNFGEVLGGLYILKTNKKTDYVIFPNDVAQGLYDFAMYEKNGKPNYYSVKSLGGSSTAMENLNFIINNFNDNAIFKDNKAELTVITSLINDKAGGKTTLSNIENFFDSFLTDERDKILTKINKISKYKAKNLSQTELNRWFESMVEISDFETFKSTMTDIYSNVLKGSEAATASLDKMYKLGKSDSFKNGYLYYPMLSYIVKYLNGNEKYVMILNTLLNFGSYIHQLTVDMYPSSFDIKISSFKESTFRFSQNSMAMNPANRPIGFKKV